MSLNIPLTWKKAISVYFIGVFVLCFIFYQTYLEIINIWMRSATFSHSFLILPICLFLIYKKSDALYSLNPKSSVAGFILLLAAILLWNLGSIVEADVFKHFASIISFSFLAINVFGYKVVKVIAFPIFYSLFMIPFGEVFIQPMMNMTASFTVATIHLFDIPIYSEGLYFELPTGNWSVVEGCSGVRYLIASVALGTLYAYLNYSSLTKKIIFVVISILLPIIGNWIRATFIVLLGHYSDMKLAVGVDHLLYGWIFFGMLMLTLFYIGGYWKDKVELKCNREIFIDGEYKVVKGLLGFGIIYLLSLYLSVVISVNSNLNNPVLITKYNGNSLDFYSESLEWMPSFQKPTTVQIYKIPDSIKDTYLLVMLYAMTEGTGKLVSSVNRYIPEKNSKWRMIERSLSTDRCPGLNAASIYNKSTNFQLVDWYNISGNSYCTAIYAKWAQLVSKINGSSLQGARMILLSREKFSEIEIKRLINIAQNIKLEIIFD